MKPKTVGLLSTAASAFLCGCPGLCLCIWGAMIAVGVPITSEVNGRTSVDTYPPVIGFGLMLFACALILIPIVVGILMLRRKEDQTPSFSPSSPAPAPVYAAAPVNPPAYQPEVRASQPQAAPPVQAAQMDSSVQEVVNRIMALNRPTAPYQIIDGRAEKVDLIAEWKIVDAAWYEIFGKAKLTKVFRIYMKLDAARHEVRAMDQEYTVQWSAGVPRLSGEASFFRGQKASVSFGTGYAFTEQLAPGQVYKYKFSTNEIKKPIQDAIASCGWKYNGVAFGKL
jgi:hypothetical protein